LVLTGELRNQIDRIWDAFWSGGISNPLEVLEQLTYLLFIRRLDELETLEERRSQRSGQPMRSRIFPEGADEQGRPWSELRWSRFKELGEAASMYRVSEVVQFWMSVDRASGCSPSCGSWAVRNRPTPPT
jgi:type I restriction enzyme M protein